MILRADARSLPLVDGCVQTCVTSPPYFGLRDYGSSHQIGLEATPDAYVASLVQVFREVRRVLKDDGTVWLNLGDSYASTPPGRCDDAHATSGLNGIGGASYRARVNGNREDMRERPIRDFGALLPKQLLGIPWRVAFALQADGWYLRSDIIWAKPNPMPESVTDRPTKAHEYLFLLSKCERYYYDGESIQEASAGAWNSAAGFGTDGKKSAGVPFLRTQGAGSFHTDAEKTGRNKRSVWTVPTMPYSGAHFATFPEKLIEPCILAGCPLGGLVLDPFLGSGTVGAVAERLGRRWVGTDLSYQPLSKARTQQRGLRFEQESA